MDWGSIREIAKRQLRWGRLYIIIMMAGLDSIAKRDLRFYIDAIRRINVVERKRVSEKVLN